MLLCKIWFYCLLLSFSNDNNLCNLYGDVVFIIVPRWKYQKEFFKSSRKIVLNTGKSFSEALILGSINPQYDKRLFMEWKLQAQNMGRTRVEHVLPMFCNCSFHDNSMYNLLSYCVLIIAKIKSSDKDLPVHMFSYFKFHMVFWECQKKLTNSTNIEFYLVISWDVS